jgi:hypothetical protein
VSGALVDGVNFTGVGGGLNESSCILTAVSPNLGELEGTLEILQKRFNRRFELFGR